MQNVINNVQHEIKRGDVFLVNLGEGVGSIQGGFMRPMIVVANPMCCKYSSVIHAVPTTTKSKRYIPTHVEISTNTGLRSASVALCEQVQLLNRDMFLEKIGHCDNYIMDKISNALRIQFDIGEIKNKVAYAN